MRQRFKIVAQSWAYKLLHSMLDPIQESNEFEANWSQICWALEYDDTEMLPSALTRGVEENFDFLRTHYRFPKVLCTKELGRQRMTNARSVICLDCQEHPFTGGTSLSEESEVRGCLAPLVTVEVMVYGVLSLQSILDRPHLVSFVRNIRPNADLYLYLRHR